MTEPWDEDGAPELPQHGIADRLGAFSLSCRHVNAEHSPRFALGQLLADMHSENFRYTDLHIGNVGLLPIGGLIIIDPGGAIACPLNPERMVDDFIVPAMELTREELTAFVSGYIERAYTSIEPRFEGFTGVVLRSLNLRPEQIVYDPRPQQAPLVTLEALLEHPPSDEVGELLRICVASLIASNSMDQRIQDNLLASLLHARPSNPWLVNVLRKLLEDRPLGTPGQIRLTDIPADHLGPRSRAATRILEALDEEPDSRPLRDAMIEGCFLLAAQAGSMDPRAGLVAAAKLATLGFAVATESSTDAARYERMHYKLWARLNALPTVPLLSLRHGDATGVETALATSLLYYRAGLFDMAFFGATLSAAKVSSENACWFAILGAMGCFRKALIVLATSLPWVTAPDQQLPGPFLTTISSVFSAYLHVFKVITFAMHELDEFPAVFFWAGSGEAFVENAKWVEQGTKICSAPDLTGGALFSFFEEGRQYFLFEDFELATPEGPLKLRSQDIFTR